MAVKTLLIHTDYIDDNFAKNWQTDVRLRELRHDMKPTSHESEMSTTNGIWEDEGRICGKQRLVGVANHPILG